MTAVPGDAPRLWLHAADDGAGAVLFVLAQHLSAQPGAPSCLLTGAADALAAGPPAALDVFLREQAPQALVLAGQPLPRPLIERARAHGLGLFLVDAPRPVERGWLPLPGAQLRLLRHFTQIHARDLGAAEALARRTRAGVTVQASGAMARHAPAPPCDRAALDELRAILGGRPAWFAQALPLAEVEAALRAHVTAQRLAHRLLLIVSPADADAAAALVERGAADGLATALRSQDEAPDETTQICIADAGEEPGLFQRLAQICYLGGGLCPGVPTPPSAPAAALGAALIHGPYCSVADLALLERLQRAGAARRIASAIELGAAVGHFLQPETLALAALKSWEIASEGSDATERVAQALLAWCRAPERGRSTRGGGA